MGFKFDWEFFQSNLVKDQKMRQRVGKFGGCAEKKIVGKFLFDWKNFSAKI